MEEKHRIIKKMTKEINDYFSYQWKEIDKIIYWKGLTWSYNAVGSKSQLILLPDELCSGPWVLRTVIWNQLWEWPNYDFGPSVVVAQLGDQLGDNGLSVRPKCDYGPSVQPNWSVIIVDRTWQF